MSDEEHARRVSGLFDDWAASGRGDRMEQGHRPTAGRVLDAVPLASGDRFLDLGTGNGWASRDAAARGARAVGVDVAPGMLRLAHGKGGATNYLRARFEALPFRDGAFRHAFSVEALYYAGDVDAALREVRRVLADDGELNAVVDYYEENEASHGWPELTGVPLHLLSEAEWARALERAGFRDATTTRVRTPEGVGDAWQWREGSLHVRGRA